MVAMTPDIDLAIRRLVWLGCPAETCCAKLFCGRACTHNLSLFQGALSISLPRLAAAQEFLYLVLLTCWMDGDKWACKSPIQVLEIFAGKGRISRMASWLGLEVRAVDITYMKPRRRTSRHQRRKRRPRSPMDFCGEAGFMFFGLY